MHGGIKISRPNYFFIKLLTLSNSRNGMPQKSSVSCLDRGLSLSFSFVFYAFQQWLDFIVVFDTISIGFKSWPCNITVYYTYRIHAPDPRPILYFLPCKSNDTYVILLNKNITRRHFLLEIIKLKTGFPGGPNRNQSQWSKKCPPKALENWS